MRFCEEGKVPVWPFLGERGVDWELRRMRWMGWRGDDDIKNGNISALWMEASVLVEDGRGDWGFRAGHVIGRCFRSGILRAGVEFQNLCANVAVCPRSCVSGVAAGPFLSRITACVRTIEAGRTQLVHREQTFPKSGIQQLYIQKQKSINHHNLISTPLLIILTSSSPPPPPQKSPH